MINKLFVKQTFFIVFVNLENYNNKLTTNKTLKNKLQQLVVTNKKKKYNFLFKILKVQKSKKKVRVL